MNRQLRDRLLCDDCEQALGVNERAVAGLVFQADGSFPWLRAVEGAATPVAPDRLVQTPSVDSDLVTRFAASVIWRAHASIHCPNVRLGAYAEAFRGYLRGERAFPELAVLRVYLIEMAPNDPPLDRLCSNPKSERLGGYHLHHFVLFGAQFNLFVGREIPPGLFHVCFLRTRRVLVGKAEHLRNGIGPIVVTARARGRLAKKREP